jgi:putative GTP pyrophosphokinase
MGSKIKLAPVEYKDWRELLLIHKFALEEIEMKVSILNEEFAYIKESNPIEHIKTRIKQASSIKEKLIRRGYEATIENAFKYIQDIAGIRIICSFKKDILTVANLIKNQDDLKIIRVCDYVTQPKKNGYQSYHMIVQVPVFLSNKKENVNVEIQIRTSAMDFWASLEHKIYYKYNNAVSEELLKRLKECAEISSELDEKMHAIKLDIDALAEVN